MSENKDEFLIEHRGRMNVNQLDCGRLIGNLMCGFLQTRSEQREDGNVIILTSICYCEMNISDLSKTSVKLDIDAYEQEFLYSLRNVS